MRVFAESRPAVAIPFVHLGYLAATALKPQGGLLLTAQILAFAAVAMMLKFAPGKNRRGKPRTHVILRRSSMGKVGALLLVAAVACGFAAYRYGKEYRVYGGHVTRNSMLHVLRDIDAAFECAARGFPRTADAIVKTVPTQAGEYDLAAAVAEDRTLGYSLDGWDVPMKLVVARLGEEMAVYSLKSAGEDGTWGTDDDITSLKYGAETCVTGRVSVIARMRQPAHSEAP